MSARAKEPIDLTPGRRVHRGHVRVAGIVFSSDDARARAAILAAMRAGDRIERISGALVLRRARPEREDTRAQPGLVLVEQAGVPTSVVLSRAEHAHARDRPGAVVLLRAGSVVTAQVEEVVDPARWIDVSSLALEAPVSLGAPPRPIEAAPAPRSAREALGLAALSPESAALGRAVLGLEAEASGRAEATDGVGVASAFVASVGEGALERWLVRAAAAAVAALDRLRAWMSSSLWATPRRAPALPSGERPATAPPRSDALGPSAPRPPGVLARLEAWLRERARRLGWRNLGQLLARRHAEHLRKLLELLDANDLDGALRHAIPLSSEKGPDSAPSLSAPRPRTELTIAPHRARGGGALGLGAGLFDHLRQRYRVIYERLLEAERWKDAAFVLAELLDDAAGAVALLEKHGFLREAAELAEGRALPPAVVVRQWLLARDVARAVSIARRHDAFGPAVARLRASDPQAARALALAWADRRAQSGDYLGAIAALEAGDAVGAARGLAVRWAERALEAGGVLEAEAIAWLLALDGDAPGRVATRVEALAADDAASSRHVRLSLYEALTRLRARPSAALADAARVAWPAAVRDRALFGEPDLPRISELEGLSRDRTLAIDRPVIVPMERKKLDKLGAPIVVAPATSGAFAVADAVVLPDRKILVALGEAGLRILRPDGRELASFDVPASALVLSDEGTRALAVMRRGTLGVVHRIDTGSRRVGDRFELVSLDAFARTFDGERWAVVIDGVAHVLDVTEDRPRATLRVRDVRAIDVDRSAGWISFIAATEPAPSAPSGLERLRYEERGLLLRERRALPERFGMEGRLHGLARFEPEPVDVMLTQGAYSVTHGLGPYPESRERPGRPRGDASLALAPGWIALAVSHAPAPGGASALDVVVLDRDERRERLVVTLGDGSSAADASVAIRLQTRRGEPPLLVVADARGRVLAVELELGRIVVDVGVR